MTTSRVPALSSLGSEGERALETHLRQRGITGWVREYEFARPEHHYRFDFAWPDKYVAVEVEGGTWSAGRHSRGTGYAADCVKYNLAAERYWRVFRFTTEMVLDQTAVEVIARVLGGASCSAA